MLNLQCRALLIVIGISVVFSSQRTVCAQTAPLTASPSSSLLLKGPVAPSFAGVSVTPCSYLEPLSAEAQQFIAAYTEAKKLGKATPVPNAEGLARYAKWQQTVLLQDFGGNCRYAVDDAAIPAGSSPKVIFFGDSITELWGSTDPAFFSSQRLDRGISGQTTAQMLVRFRQDVLDLHPRTVHILAGINDIAGNTGPTSLDRIEGNIMSMVELAQAHRIRVILGSLLPAAVIPWRTSIKPAAHVLALNAWLKAYAEQQHLTYVDYYSALKDENGAFKAAWTLDGVHPNHAGYMIMDPLANRALAQ